VERLQDARWLVRAAALEALGRTPAPGTVDAVVERMPLEEGRLLEDCARVLKALTGQDLGTNFEGWRQWWQANRDTWTGPPPPRKHDPHDLSGAPDVGHRKTGFFGIETPSRRLVYVIDVSGSMNVAVSKTDERTRAAVAKEELTQALRGLEDGALFNLVFFSSGVTVWKPEMVTATVETRREAADFVRDAAVVGGTATYDALVAAFGLADVGRGRKREQDGSGDAKVDTVILLSDGQPTLGRLTRPDQIREAVRELNRGRGITVHTVAFGADADQVFLAGLAEDTGGTFRAR
jgi:hypothetical protein